MWNVQCQLGAGPTNAIGQVGLEEAAKAARPEQNLLDDSAKKDSSQNSQSTSESPGGERNYCTTVQQAAQIDVLQAA